MRERSRREEPHAERRHRRASEEHAARLVPRRRDAERRDEREGGVERDDVPHADVDVRRRDREQDRRADRQRNPSAAIPRHGDDSPDEQQQERDRRLVEEEDREVRVEAGPAVFAEKVRELPFVIVERQAAQAGEELRRGNRDVGREPAEMRQLSRR